MDMDMDIMTNIFPGFHTCVGFPKNLGQNPIFFKVYTYFWGTFNLVYGIKIPSWNAFMGVLKMYTSYELQSKSGRRWNWLTCTRTDKIQTPPGQFSNTDPAVFKEKGKIWFPRRSVKWKTGPWCFIGFINPPPGVKCNLIKEKDFQKSPFLENFSFLSSLHKSLHSGVTSQRILSGRQILGVCALCKRRLHNMTKKDLRILYKHTEPLLQAWAGVSSGVIMKWLSWLLRKHRLPKQ